MFSILTLIDNINLFGNNVRISLPQALVSNTIRSLTLANYLCLSFLALIIFMFYFIFFDFAYSLLLFPDILIDFYWTSPNEVIVVKIGFFLLLNSRQTSNRDQNEMTAGGVK